MPLIYWQVSWNNNGLLPVRCWLLALALAHAVCFRLWCEYPSSTILNRVSIWSHKSSVQISVCNPVPDGQNFDVSNSRLQQSFSFSLIYSLIQSFSFLVLKSFSPLVL